MTPSTKLSQKPDKNLRYALDTNTFRNYGFINSLRAIKTQFEFLLPTVVTLEVGFFFMAKGAAWEDFTREIQKFDGTMLDWKSVVVPDVVKSALQNRAALPFRYHFRDFLIGSQCIKEQASLITYNTKHFEWCAAIERVTPEQFTTTFKEFFSSQKDEK